MDNVLVNKAATIERCIGRIKAEYAAAGEDFDTDYTRQDSVILNLERCAQACIDMGTHIIRLRRLGIPQTSREIFALLETHGYLPPELDTRLQAMVGFRNIAVHDYQRLNIDIVRAIVETRLDDFTDFASLMLKQFG